MLYIIYHITEHDFNFQYKYVIFYKGAFSCHYLIQLELLKVNIMTLLRCAIYKRKPITKMKNHKPTIHQLWAHLNFIVFCKMFISQT